MKNIPALFLWILLILPSFSQAQCTVAVNGNVYLVDVATDGGPGSLRQAIIDANNDNIGGLIAINGPFNTVFLNSPLPTVTCDSLNIFDFFPMIIDGQNIVPEPGIIINSPTSCLGPFVSAINFTSTIFEVTNTNDSGAGSLRDMIQQSNFSASQDVINFNIPGTPPHEITLSSTLPQITKPLSIDGTSQPLNGFAGSGPKIELDGVTNTFDGLVFNYANAPYLYNGSVYGLYLNNFMTAIETNRANDFIIGAPGKSNVISGNTNGTYLERDRTLLVQNNYIGTDTSGTLAEANNFGLSTIGDSLTTHIISNNVISGNISAGMLLFSEDNFTFSGNLVGTDKAGNFAIPNQTAGLVAVGKNLTIGGTTPGSGNLFSGNCISSPTSNKSALIVSAENSVVIGNKFGTNISGTDTIPNKFGSCIYFYGKGLQIGGPSLAERNIISGSANGIVSDINNPGGIILNNFIGTDITGTLNFGNDYNISLGTDSILVIDNIIADATFKGIETGAGTRGIVISGNEIRNNTLEGIFNYGNGNTFSQNSIYDNGGAGILNYLNANDSIQPPVITYVDTVSIDGTALPGATVELFYSQSANFLPQGKDYIATVTADPGGVWNYNGPVSNPLYVTATQTDALQNTSSFSELWLQSTPDVWPGDFNYDLVVDNYDVIFHGMAFGETGALRNNASLNWIAQPAIDWASQYFNGLNHKHADGDGNGIVNGNDLNAVNQNYSLTHPFRVASNNAIYDFYLVAINDTIAPGGYASFEIHAGTNSLPVDELYGVSWSLLFDVILADTNAITYDYTSSSLGIINSNMESFAKSFYSAGSSDLALTRTDQINANLVSGILGIVHIPTKQNITTTEVLHANPDNIRGLKINGNEILFNVAGDSVVIDPVFVGIPSTDELIFSLYPNPSSADIYINSGNNILSELKIFDLAGKLIYESSINKSSHKFNTDILSDGIYTIAVYGSNAIGYKKLIVNHNK